MDETALPRLKAPRLTLAQPCQNVLKAPFPNDPYRQPCGFLPRIQMMYRIQTAQYYYCRLCSLFL
jgi:hypothetical protein